MSFEPVSYWGIALGFGLGLAVGMITASGIEFDKAESAKFIGSLFGSIIAVSGAVSLYYLKEHQEKKSRRRHLKLLVDRGINFAKFTKEKMENLDRFESAFHTFIQQFERAYRFAEKFQYDDFIISEVFAHLEVSRKNKFSIEKYDEMDETVRKLCSLTVDSYETLLKNADSNLPQGFKS